MKPYFYGLDFMTRHDDKTDVPIKKKGVESAWKSSMIKILVFLFV